MAKNENRLRTRFGSVVTAGLVASALVAAPATMLVGAVPAMAEISTDTKPEYENHTPASINYGNGWRQISDIYDLSSLDPTISTYEVRVYINETIVLNKPLTIGFTHASDRKVCLYLNGHKISNEQRPTNSGEYYDYSNTNAIVANCNLTVSDYDDSLDKHPWAGNIEGVGQVYSENGYAVATSDGCQVTIDGGLYNSENLEPLLGNIRIDKGAFLRDPRESVPESVNQNTVVTSSTVNDPNSQSYWLVGKYAHNAWGDNEGSPFPEASNNVVTIKQMQKPDNPNISQLHVQELINNTNYSLHITGKSVKCGGTSVPADTILSPGGHLSCGIALSGGKIDVSPQTYTGQRITPQATVTDSEGHVVGHNKYYLMYQDNVEVGTAQVEAIGLDEYGGSRVSGTFEITAAPTPTPEPQPTPTPTPTPAPTPASEAEELRAATTNLGAFIAGMDQRRYTNESVQAVQAALDEANQVLADFNEGKATKEQVQAALDKLNEAYGALEHKAGIPMHRLYNPNSGEHFYTASTDERDHLVGVGWKSEGTGWTAPASSNTPVYRLYNPNAGDHHYTTDASERDTLIEAGWNYEGIGWFSDDAREVPLYRQYNPNAQAGSHNFTTSQDENDHLVSLGWRAEGTAWYGMRTVG